MNVTKQTPNNTADESATAPTVTLANYYCPRGYDECVDARGCVYPGRCSRGEQPKQVVSYRLEMPNGEAPNFNKYLKVIMHGQDLEAWKANPGKLSQFVRDCFASYLSNVNVIICTK